MLNVTKKDLRIVGVASKTVEGVDVSLIYNLYAFYLKAKKNVCFCFCFFFSSYFFGKGKEKFESVRGTFVFFFFEKVLNLNTKFSLLLFPLKD